MDWLQILIVLLFLLFPLLQQLLERRGPPPPPPGTESEGLDAQQPQWRLPDVPRSPQDHPQPHAEIPEWVPDEWIVEDDEEAAELLDLQASLPAESVPEAVRVSAPVVSLEPLVVNRSTSNERRVARDEQRTPLTLRSAAPQLTAALHDRSELRRAVLLAEILAPPRSLD